MTSQAVKTQKVDRDLFTQQLIHIQEIRFKNEIILYRFL